MKECVIDMSPGRVVQNRDVLLEAPMDGFTASRHGDISIARSGRERAVPSLRDRYVPCCTQGTFANNSRSFPRGSLANCDCTSNTIV
jgi:hypothetical protein